MRAKFGRGLTVVSKNGGYRQTDTQTQRETVHLYIVDRAATRHGQITIIIDYAFRCNRNQIF